MKYFYTLLTLTILAAAPNAPAQSAVGTWTGETSGAVLAPRSMTVVLASDGTGTMQVDNTERPLIDLDIEGNTLSFAFRPLLGGTRPANFVFRYRGEFDGEKMTLYPAMDREDGSEPVYSEESLVLMRE